MKARTKIVTLMIALSVISYLDRRVLVSAAPTLMKQFGISEPQMGDIFSAFLIAYTLFMIPGGWLADRFGPRRVLTVMGVATALFTGLSAVAGRPGLGTYLGVVPAFMLIRFVLGAFTAPLYPACARLTANWIPAPKRAGVQGLIIAGAPLGSALTPLVVVWLVQTSGWQASLVLAMAVTGVAAWLWHHVVRDTPGEPPQTAQADHDTKTAQAPAGWRQLLTNRQFVLLTASYFALNYFEYIFFYWMDYYFATVRKVPATEAAVYTTSLFVTMMIMTPLAGWVADRLAVRWGNHASRRVVAVVGMATSAVLLLLGTRMDSPVVVAAFFALALGFASGSEGPFWASAIEAAGPNAGSAGGILNGFGNLGGAIAPWLTPRIAARFGWTAALCFASAFVLVGAAAWVFMTPAKRRRT